MHNHIITTSKLIYIAILEILSCLSLEITRINKIFVLKYFDYLLQQVDVILYAIIQTLNA